MPPVPETPEIPPATDAASPPIAAADGPCRLSVVIPAFNESRRIRATLENALAWLRAHGRTAEIIVVDDGSGDGTLGVVDAVAMEAGAADIDEDHWQLERVAIRTLRSTRHFGKGAAVRRGMLAAEGELLLLCDADESTPISELPRLIAAIERGADVAIGSRDMPDSRLDPPQPALRRLAAAAFRALRRTFLLRRLRDTQCGFKLFRRDAAHAAFAQAREDGWLFDCEVLAIVERRGLRIEEVGVLWRDQPGSRVRPLRDGLAALVALGRIRERMM